MILESSWRKDPAAALGLAERTDALCLAVSEERGVTSVATDGVLRGLYRPEELAIEIMQRVGVERHY